MTAGETSDPRDGILEEIHRMQQQLALLEQRVALLSPPPKPAVPPPPPPPPPRAAAEAPGFILELEPGEEAADATASSDRLAEATEWLQRDRQREQEAAAATAAAPARDLEQALGTRGMLFVGLGVLLLGAVFFLKFAIDRGWISPALRLLVGAAAGTAMIAIGEWALLRRQLRLFAGAVSAAGLVMLYFVVFVASPIGWYQLIGSTAAFALMCGVTALGAALAVQMRMLSSSVLAMIGAFATPLLLSTGENRQILLMNYLLAVDIGFLAVAWIRRWEPLSLGTLAGTAAVTTLWASQHYSVEAWPATLAYTWVFGLLFIAFAIAGQRRAARDDADKPAPPAADELAAPAWWLGLAYTACSLCLAAWFAMGAGAEAMPLAVQMTTVTAALLLWLGLGLVLRWPGLLFVWWLWALAAAAVWSTGTLRPPWLNETFSVWIWAIGGVLLAATIVQIRRAGCTQSLLDAYAIPSGLMFLLAYGLSYLHLSPEYPDWMGLHAVASAAVLGGLWALLRRSMPALARAVIIVGALALLAAAPLQWDGWRVLAAWSVLSLALLAVCLRLREPVVLVTGLVALTLALTHLWAIDFLQSHARLLLDVPHVPVTRFLVLGLWMAAACLVAAALLRRQRAVADRREMTVFARQLAPIAAVLFLAVTALELPGPATTWSWILLAASVAVYSLARPTTGAGVAAALLLLTAAARWLIWDTVAGDYIKAHPEIAAVVLNWKFFAALALAIVCIGWQNGWNRRDRDGSAVGKDSRAVLRWLGGLVGVVVIWLAVTVEIWRYFLTGPTALWEHNFQARQMSYSIWWGLYATLLMVVGFIRGRKLPRVLALALFSVTVAKVFLVDMSNVEAAYRIGSFVCLGALLVAGSFLYHRYFKPAAAARDGQPSG